MLLTLNGTVVWYDLIGDESGEVVCLLHPLASDSGIWAQQVPALLRAGFRVLRVDLPGHGGSHIAGQGYSVAEACGVVTSVMDSAGVSSCHIVGLSIGGVIGTALSIRAPDRVKSLMMSNALLYGNEAGRAAWTGRIIAVSQAKSLEPLAAGMLDRWVSPAFRDQNPVAWQQALDTIRATPAEGFIAAAAFMRDTDLTGDLSRIAAPALVTVGELDQACPSALGRKAADGIAKSEFIELPGARHFPNLDLAPAYNRILVDWCNSQRGVAAHG
jgi:3-oxoadipate enol-lactonase